MHGTVMDASEFAISPAIPNRPVRLEVDQARQREVKRWLLVGLVLASAALFDGSQRSGIVSHGYRLEEIQRQRASEEAASRQLRLEVETLSAPARIEALATDRLHLVVPARGDAIVVERVVPAAQPPSSLVASR